MYSRTPGRSSASFGESATRMPPRPGTASSGILMARSSGLSSCASVAWNMRTGMAGMTFCWAFSRSDDGLPVDPTSVAATSQRNCATLNGAVTSQPTSRASPAASDTRATGKAWPARLPFTSTSVWRCEALRTVKRASKRSPSRTSGGKPDNSIRSWVARIEVWPVPNKPLPESATAMMRNEVIESLSGMSTLARPFSSSGTFAFHNNNVSNNSRAV